MFEFLVGDELDYLVEQSADTFAILASATRLHVLYQLSLGETDVGSLAEAVGGSVAVVSQHLAKLRLADLVTARTDGRRQIYRVEDPHVLTLVNQAVEHHADLRQRHR